MKVIVHLFCVASILVFSFHRAPAAPAATNQPVGFRLIVELQDGSKIIGKNGDDNFQFRSEVLGEMKLPLERIRSIACRPKTNLVQLAATNGDTLTAQFVTRVVRVGTAFGNFKLPVHLIKRIQVSTMRTSGQTRLGLVALWSGEGNGNDAVERHDAKLTDITFAEGQVGQAFVFNGSGAHMSIPASSSLDVGMNNGFTIEIWINPLDFSFQSICEWNQNSQIGTHLELNEFNADGSLWGDVIDTLGNQHVLSSAGGVITTNSWQHVAMTYDKASGVAVLYRNGAVEATANLGVCTPQTSFDFYMGSRPSGAFAGLYFHGEMDESSVYNRALTASEIQADYEAGKGSN
jgi:hypothetical protein